VNAVVTAIVFIPKAHLAAYTGACLEYCAARGYEVAGIVSSTWLATLAIRLGGNADVIVVARPDHIDPAQELRVEVATTIDGATSPAPRPRNAEHVARRLRRPNRL
jgi:sugar phosphate isomerase/epimerase